MSFVLQKDSGLLAVTCDDLCVRIFDIGTRKLVRELRGFGGRILDVVSHYSIFPFIFLSNLASDFVSGLKMACSSVDGLHHPHV
jgi:hypothetical protein